jgi:hypothetical protein
MRVTKKFAAALLGSLTLACAQGAGADEPHAPDQVHTALRILASVYADMESKLPDHLDRLPHENQEFQDGSAAMRDAMKDEPADYKATVLSALRKATTAAQRVSDTSKSNDVAKIRPTLDALADSMRALNDLFPQSLRAEPGSVPAPQHGQPPSS